MPELNLADLLAELKLDILSYLPAKEIQKARQVSSHFKQLVDNPENTGILVRRTAVPSQVEYVRQNILNFDPKKEDLLTLYSRIVKLNGEDGDLTIRIAARIWFHSLGITDPPRQPRRHVEALIVDLDAIHDRYHQGNKPHTTRKRSSVELKKKNFNTDLEDLFAVGTFPNCGLDVQNVLGYWDRIVKGNELKAAGHQKQKFLLTDPDDPWDRDRPAGWIDIEHRQLCGWLQIPEIPEWAKHQLFCYAVKTQRAYGKIAAVLEGRTTVTNLEFAAIKEELFLTLDVDRFG